LGGDRAAVAGWLGNAARADLVITRHLMPR